MCVVGDGSKNGINMVECMGPSWRFIAFGIGSGEEDIIEFGVDHMELMWTNAYDGAV